ncbi:MULTISPECIES: hypothetical protein [unclassified Rathayibacter]|uniref:hypothetical protein n=1 Tax=unclassified Rathayibacter TaxID=2609250 RepID=UPI000CE8AED0|nr:MULTISPECIES: hypothetical protein [unclassified Rathayibacter]PPF32276.1 hypothetical protein C5B93_15900 [Rathayibacter sp. AY1A2]PPI27943.1 hypothetical protein C5D66_15095 [Rathayibacter sp. AY1B4]
MIDSVDTPLSARVDRLEASLARIRGLESEIDRLRADRDRWKSDAGRWEARFNAAYAAEQRPGAFRPIRSQNELDRIIRVRLARLRGKPDDNEATTA